MYFQYINFQLVNLFLSANFMEDQDKKQEVLKPRIRKSLLDLSPNERKRYFFCLKMLDVLPPFSEDHKNWQFISPAYAQVLSKERKVIKINDGVSRVQPICLHDVLVASHQTACEHMSLYFGYYHRHYIMNFELFVNFAHEIMKNNFQNLIQTYPRNEYPQLYDQDDSQSNPRQEAWQLLFDQYKKFSELEDYVAAHYWNPCNYNDQLDLLFPDELRNKQQLREQLQLKHAKNPKDQNYSIERIEKRCQLDQVDHLCKLVRNSYAWNVNVAKRWFVKGRDQEKTFQGLYTGVPTQLYNAPQNSFTLTQKYSDVYERVMKGKINPRNTDVDTCLGLFKKRKNYRHIKGWIDTANQHSKTMIYEGCRESSNNFQNNEEMTFEVNPASNDELKTAYFSAANQQHYISLADMEQNGILKGKSVASITEYNQLTPHYILAQSVAGKNGKGKNMRDFIYPFRKEKDSIFFQSSHNIMHNNFQSMMNDAQYSVTSLIFYPYHAWLDLVLQLKIRQANGPQKNGKQRDHSLQQILSKYYYVEGQFPVNLMGRGNKLVNFINSKQEQKSDEVQSDKLQIFLKDALQNNTISKNKLKLNVAGSYPISQWIDPNITNIQNPTSKDISVGFFAGQYMVRKNGELVESRKINQVYKHFVRWHKQKRFSKFKGFQKFNFNFNYQIRDPKGNYILDNYKLPSYIADIINLTIIPQTEEADKIERKFMKAQAEKRANENNTQEQGQLYILEKILAGNLVVFAQHSPDLKNGLFSLRLYLNNLMPILAKTLSEKQLDDFYQYQISGLFLTYMNIFGKQNKSAQCYKCTKNKAYFSLVDDDFRKNALQLWKIVHLEGLNEIFFDTRNPKKKVKSLQKYVQLKPIPQISTKFLTGAQQIQLTCTSNANPKLGQFIRVGVESYSNSKQTIEMVISRKKHKFNTDFQFYKIHDVAGRNSQINKYDNFSFNKVQIKLQYNKGKFEQIEFQIPNFARLLRLNCEININQEQNKIKYVVVSDADYQLKRSYYSSFGKNNSR